MLTILARFLILAIGLLAIGFMLFLHELGHFIIARLFNVDVDVLSYGIGPKLFSYQGSSTEYRISLIPFGGYCRMSGSIDLTMALRGELKSLEKTEAGSYFSVAPWKRFLIYLAGPGTNFLLAVLLIAISAMIPVERLSDVACVTPISEYRELFGTNIKQEGIEKGDILISSGDREFLDWQDAETFLRRQNGDVDVTVLRDGELIETTLISNNGTYGIALLQRPVIGRSVSDEFEEDDVILSVNGEPVESTYDIYEATGPELLLTIERDGMILERRVSDGHLPFAWKSGIRISTDEVQPFIYGVKTSAKTFSSVLSALGAFITFHLEDALSMLTGPVKAAESIGSITVEAFETSGRSGMRGILRLLAIISISLSAGNILPIPTFDGGQMLIALSEMIRKKPLSPRTYVILQIVGMVLALLIMISMYALDFKAYFLS